MSIFKKIILFSLIMIVLPACFYVDKQKYDVNIPKDNFYYSMGGWDYERIPLIEPYEAINVGYIHNFPWFIDLNLDSHIYRTSSIESGKIDIKNGVIYIYSQDGILEGVSYSDIWMILIPSEQIEIGFTNEEKFNKYLSENNLEEPVFEKLNDLYDELVEIGYLDWFPEEYKIMD